MRSNHREYIGPRKITRYGLLSCTSSALCIFKCRPCQYEAVGPIHCCVTYLHIKKEWPLSILLLSHALPKFISVRHTVGEKAQGLTSCTTVGQLKLQWLQPFILTLCLQDTSSCPVAAKVPKSPPLPNPPSSTSSPLFP